MLHRRVVSIFLPLPQIQMKMKRKLAYTTGLLLIACTFTACDMLGGSCQTCQTVSYENGNPIAWGTPADYCDNDLVTIKSTPPSTVNGVTTQWECN
jgi:hypothetical protein